MTPSPGRGPLIALSSDFIRAKEYFEAIVASSGDLICTTDIRGRIIYFSPGAEAMLGLSADSMVGRPCHDFYFEGRAAAERVMHLLRESPGGTVRNHEMKVKASGGRVLHVSMSASFLKDGRGRVIGTLGVGKDITDRVELELKLREMTRTDDLTGLYNQRHFHDRLREEAARAQRQGRKLSMILFDLDGFKQVNDRLGHLEGDRILRAFARSLSDNIRREVDAAFRYGGDEFVLLLPETGARRARDVAGRIAEAAKATLAPDGVSTSWGVAELHTGDVSEFVRRADAAMFAMKSGRKGVRLRGTEIARAFADPPRGRRV
ncbi:MAG: diguanylate cyclase [Elusimicrobia bacterium]|nr:diguanylate cyclase [Elusimicrobiota bacterium]